MKEKTMKIAFLISIVSTIFFAVFKIMHIRSGDAFVYTYLISTAIWLIIAIMEIWSSARLQLIEKMMWTVSLMAFGIAFGLLTGMLYFLNGRRRVIARSNPFTKELFV